MVKQLPILLCAALMLLPAEMSGGDPAASRKDGQIAELIDLLKQDKRLTPENERTLRSHGKRAVPALIECLDSGNKDVAREAMRILGQLGPVAFKAVPRLLADARNKKAPLRVEAIRALGAIGPRARAAVPGLLEDLKDLRGPAVEIVTALGGIGPDAGAAVPAVRKSLDSGNVLLQIAAARSLGRIGPEARPALPKLVSLVQEESMASPEAICAICLISEGKQGLDLLVALLRGKSYQFRKTDWRRPDSDVLPVIWTLGPRARSIFPEVKVLLRDKDAWVRQIAYRVLERIEPRETDAIPVLLEAFREEHNQQRWADQNIRMVTDLLVKYGRKNTEVVEALIQSLNSPSFGERHHATIALGNIGPSAKAAVPVLIRALRVPIPEIRSSAVDALGQVGPAARPAVPALLSLLKDEPDLEFKAAQALGRIGPDAREAVPALRKALESKRPYLRLLAALALYRVDRRAREAVPVLLQETANKHPFLQRAAIDALGELGADARTALPRLKELRSDEKETTALAAAVALYRIDPTGPPPWPRLLEALESSEQVRESALSYLNQLGRRARPLVPDLIQLYHDLGPSGNGHLIDVLRQIDPEATLKAGIR